MRIAKMLLESVFLPDGGRARGLVRQLDGVRGRSDRIRRCQLNLDLVLHAERLSLRHRFPRLP